MSETPTLPRTPPAYLQRPTWQLVVLLAWPVLLQNLLIMTVNLSDRLLAGRFQSVSAEDQAASQAAQTTAGYLAWVIMSYTTLVTVGATTVVAHCTGAGDRRGALKATHQALVLAVILAFAGTTIGLIVLEPGLRLLNLRGPALTFAVAYLKPLLLMLVFQMVGAAGVACLVGSGDTRTGLYILGGVALLNLPLAWLFFHGAGPIPGFGFPGIAVGTAVSQTIGGLAVIATLMGGRLHLHLRLSWLKPDVAVLRRLLRVSVPAAADSLSMQAGYLWFVALVNGLGDVASAAHGVALGWEALAYQSGAALGTAAMSLVGQNQGAGRPARAARTGWVAFGLGVALMSLMGTVFFTLAGPMFRLFCPHEGQLPLVQAGVPVLRLVAFAMPALASCIVLGMALRGAGDTRVPVLFTWFGFFGVRIPLAYLLTRQQLNLGPFGTFPGAGLGLMGAWLAMFADIHVRGLLVMARFAGGRWQSLRI
jgi:putative MATE family efflux protein